ncbi:MAG: hypothetical protein WKF57_05960 [Nakamurella sp.]
MTSNGITIGVDLDGVCADYENALRATVADERRIARDTLLPATRWSLVECGWFDTLEDYNAAHFSAVQSGMFAWVTPIAGASEALHALSRDGFRIRIITHRLLLPGTHGRVVIDTAAFLDSAQIPYSDLCFVTDKTTVGCDMLIDDAPKNVIAARAAGTPTIVFDQPYNQELDGLRACGWPEAEQLIRATADTVLTARQQ